MFEIGSYFEFEWILWHFNILMSFCDPTGYTLVMFKHDHVELEQR